MRNETRNFNEEVNARIEERSMKPEGKRADNFKTLWYDKLTEAAKEEDPKTYKVDKEESKEFRQACRRALL